MGVLVNKKILKIYFFQFIPFLSLAGFLLFLLDYSSRKYQFELPYIVRVILGVGIFGYAVKIALPALKEAEQLKRNKKMNKENCPFNVGEKVKFIGGDKLGWYQNPEGFGLKVNNTIVIHEIKQNIYIYDSQGNGGWHWKLFEKC